MAPAVTEAPIVDPASTPRFQGFTNSLSEESEKVDGFETPVLPSTRRAHGSRKQKSKKVSKLKIFLRFFNIVHFEKNGTKLVCERMKTNIFVATSNPTDLLRGQEPDRRNSSTTACPCLLLTSRTIFTLCPTKSYLPRPLNGRGGGGGCINKQTLPLQTAFCRLCKFFVACDSACAV